MGRGPFGWTRRGFLAGLAGCIAAPPAHAAEPFIAQRFAANGRERDGWSWLDGAAGSQYGEWHFAGLPADAGDLRLEIHVLVPGGTDVRAAPRFRLAYGNPGSGTMGGVLVPVEVALAPIDGPSDPSHPMLQGEVVIARASLQRMVADRTILFLRAERLPGQPAVAVNRLAVVVHVVDTTK